MSQVKAVICSKYPDTKDETGMKYWYLWNFKYVFLTQRQSVRHYHKSKQKPLLALFAQIMVALYNENLFPTDIIIFFLKSNQKCLHCWAWPHLFPACHPPCPTWLTHFLISSLLVFLHCSCYYKENGMMPLYT